MPKYVEGSIEPSETEAVDENSLVHFTCLADGSVVFSIPTGPGLATTFHATAPLIKKVLERRQETLEAVLNAKRATRDSGLVVAHNPLNPLKKLN